MQIKRYLAAALLAAALALAGCGTKGAEIPPPSAGDTGGTAAPPADTPGTGANAPERTRTGTVLRDGAEIAVYLEIGETQIAFWDSASGGTLLFTAAYGTPLPGAETAEVVCTYPDLDEDGNSDLTADFAFPDGSSASLVWFYADGELYYNEEFSRLPGEPTAAGETP